MLLFANPELVRFAGDRADDVIAEVRAMVVRRWGEEEAAEIDKYRMGLENGRATRKKESSARVRRRYCAARGDEPPPQHQQERIFIRQPSSDRPPVDFRVRPGGGSRHFMNGPEITSPHGETGP